MIAGGIASSRTPGDERSLSQVEKDYTLAVLEANGGNRTKTATQLEIAPATLYRKLAEYGVTGK